MENQMIQFGVDAHDPAKKIGIGLQNLRRHLWLIGKSGSGKTTFLENLVVQIANAERGLLFLDIYGEMTTVMGERLGKHVTPESRQKLLTVSPNSPDDVEKYDFAEWLRDGKIVVMNLAKGRLGEELSEAVYTSVLTRFIAAMADRADIPESARHQFFLIFDEVWYWDKLGEGLLNALIPEARKYGISLVVTQQYLDQLTEENRMALLGNMGNILILRVGMQDSQTFESDISPRFKKELLLDLPAYHAILKTMTDALPGPVQVVLAPPLT